MDGIKVRALPGYDGIKHPVTGTPALETGETEWPRDQATFRVMADGSVEEATPPPEGDALRREDERREGSDTPPPDAPREPPFPGEAAPRGRGR